ncbi:phosphopentomutase [Balneolaceae bacterium ANBcel3]|nr:phosphopentomutase [Balneolaceae bacterium ANBcel3]
MGRCLLLIIDGLGVGAQEDAAQYQDTGTNTLGHVVNQTRCMLPNFETLGMGNVIPLDTVPPVRNPSAAFGKLREYSAGKDSTTGHWEIAGIKREQPFPVYPEGFPDDVIDLFCRLTTTSHVLANIPSSGTAVIEEFGELHQATAAPIVYTSADSVFQIAAHTETVPLEKLYEWCYVARNEVMTGVHGVGRVIARPFTGSPGAYVRLSDQRKDFSLIPPDPFLPSFLMNQGIETISVGKVIDLFADKGFSSAFRTKSNAEGLACILELLDTQQDGFIFINLIETDQDFGHRNDVQGYAEALASIDVVLPEIRSKMNEDDLLMITGDHGNDPTTKGTDHTREFTPLLVYPAEKAISVELPTRDGFFDIAASVCRYFGLKHPFPGVSFIK